MSPFFDGRNHQPFNSMAKSTVSEMAIKITICSELLLILPLIFDLVDIEKR